MITGIAKIEMSFGLRVDIYSFRVDVWRMLE